MAYIYCITNIINGKQYVGKTMYSITKRFQEHCSDYLKDRCQNRPLYQAMKKYGVSNFIVHQLWQCDPEEASSYEKIFIDKLETYGDKGYNATKGGDGKLLFDYKKIISLYKEGHSIGEVAREIQCCYDTVFKVIHLYNIPIHLTVNRGQCKEPKRVLQISVDTGEVLKEFISIAEASHWVVDNGYAKTYNGGVRQKISLCCQNKVNTAYKFNWEFVNNE